MGPGTSVNKINDIEQDKSEGGSTDQPAVIDDVSGVAGAGKRGNSRRFYDITITDALEATDTGFSCFDAENHLIAWNSSYARTCSTFSKLIVSGTTFSDLIYAEASSLMEFEAPEARDQWIEERLATHSHDEATFESKHPDGRIYEIKINRTNSGGFVEAHTDVTEARFQQSRLAHYTNMIRGTLESISEGLCVFDANGQLASWNALFFELLDLPHVYAQIGTPLSDLIMFSADRGDFGPGDPIEQTQQIVEQLTSGDRQSYDRAVPNNRIVEVEVNPLADGGFVVTYGDVTDKRAGEQALRESEERYALAAAGANDGLWDWDLRTDRIYLSPRWKAMLGYPEAEIGDGTDEWFGRIHSDDTERVTAQIDAHLRGGVSHFESEHRMLHQDESYRWMLTRGLAVRGDDDKAYRVVGSQTDITDRKRAEEQLIHDALHDSLTGLANRTLFLERARQTIDRQRRAADFHFAVIYIDLDRFKVVNESLGHVQGDDLIIATSRRLEQSVSFGDTVARLGGDDFAVLLEEAPGREVAREVGDVIRNALASPFVVGGKEVFVTASMGIAHSDNGYKRPEDALRDAELAMYRAKELGKDQAVLFDNNLRHSTVTPLDLDSDLRRAIERSEMDLHYQPIIALETGRIAGFEALIRWEHSDRGLLLPSEFIPLAEETGLIVALGQWVLERACREALRWNELSEVGEPLQVSVNLSSRQFTGLDLVSMIVDCLDETGLEPSNLKLEITESALMANAQRSARMLSQLRELNIRVCVDDFGTGYSSLSYLHTFPIDTLKIDKSFVTDMGRNHQNLEIVRTISMLAANLKFDVIAEGVESAEQMAQLRALGCQYAQGFFFSRPLDADEAVALLKENKSW